MDDKVLMAFEDEEVSTNYVWLVLWTKQMFILYSTIDVTSVAGKSNIL